MQLICKHFQSICKTILLAEYTFHPTNTHTDTHRHTRTRTSCIPVRSYCMLIIHTSTRSYVYTSYKVDALWPICHWNEHSRGRSRCTHMKNTSTRSFYMRYEVKSSDQFVDVSNILEDSCFCKSIFRPIMWLCNMPNHVQEKYKVICTNGWNGKKQYQIPLPFYSIYLFRKWTRYENNHSLWQSFDAWTYVLCSATSTVDAFFVNEMIEIFESFIFVDVADPLDKNI